MLDYRLLTLLLPRVIPPTLVIADGNGYTVAPVNPVPHGSPEGKC